MIFFFYIYKKSFVKNPFNMSFFLISLIAVSVAFSAVIGISYLRSLYYVFLSLKTVKLIMDYRIKAADQNNHFILFLHNGLCVFSKDIFLHYYFIGKYAHSDSEFAEKLFVFSLTSILFFAPKLAFITNFYGNDTIRTIIYIGYGLSDALALNWVSHLFAKSSIDQWNYLFLMSFISCIPGFFMLLREIFSFSAKNVVGSLRETRNIVTMNMVLAGLNLWLLDYLRKIDSVYALVSYYMVNTVGMILYFSYKSYSFDKYFIKDDKEKKKFMNLNENESKTKEPEEEVKKNKNKRKKE